MLLVIAGEQQMLRAQAVAFLICSVFILQLARRGPLTSEVLMARGCVGQGINEPVLLLVSSIIYMPHGTWAGQDKCGRATSSGR